MKDMSEVTLMTIARGAVPELFQEEFTRLLANIDDPNTDAEAARKITIEMIFKPSENRDSAAVRVLVKSKLPGFRPAGASIWISKKGGGIVALQANPDQGELNLVKPERTQP
jgi:hypothetical protein